VSVDEPSIQESAESDQPAVRVVSGYSATRRTARKHKRGSAGYGTVRCRWRQA
jgi:hypothetical protein